MIIGKGTTPEWVVAAAMAAGVSRLADITRLDSIGIPVFQAVRPWGRGLSVHQGKGLTANAAKIGALMEAVESDHAEKFEGGKRAWAFDDLPTDERAPTMADFAADRAIAPSPLEPMFWAPAERLAGAATIWVPFDFVSLDFSRDGDLRLDRSSTGLGAGRDREAAAMVGVLEVIERDAFRAWRVTSAEDRTMDRINIDSIPYEWFRNLIGNLEIIGIKLSIYNIASIINLPVFVAELVDFGVGNGQRARALGVACRTTAEEALMRSVVEAAQSRLTSISAVRDDILNSEPEAWETSDATVLGLPMPAHLASRSWADVAAAFAPRPAKTSSELGGLLATAGFPDAAQVDLSHADRDVGVVKVVVPGLGCRRRSRRAAL